VNGTEARQIQQRVATATSPEILPILTLSQLQEHYDSLRKARPASSNSIAHLGFAMIYSNFFDKRLKRSARKNAANVTISKK
jgi:hypothetical protein